MTEPTMAPCVKGIVMLLRDLAQDTPEVAGWLRRIVAGDESAIACIEWALPDDEDEVEE